MALVELKRRLTGIITLAEEALEDLSELDSSQSDANQRHRWHALIDIEIPQVGSITLSEIRAKLESEGFTVSRSRVVSWLGLCADVGLYHADRTLYARQIDPSPKPFTRAGPQGLRARKDIEVLAELRGQSWGDEIKSKVLQSISHEVPE